MRGEVQQTTAVPAASRPSFGARNIRVSGLGSAAGAPSGVVLEPRIIPEFAVLGGVFGQKRRGFSVSCFFTVCQSLFAFQVVRCWALGEAQLCWNLILLFVLIEKPTQRTQLGVNSTFKVSD